MPLTNAQKVAAYQKRQKAKMMKMETALREIIAHADRYPYGRLESARYLAEEALK